MAAFSPEIVIHCGDIGSEGVLFDLVEAFPHARILAVWGNVDLYDDTVLDFPSASGVEVAEKHIVEVSGYRMGVAHGHDPACLEALSRQHECGVLLTGHTHVRRDEHVGRTRIINPGAVYRSAEPGAAILQMPTLQLTYIDLPEK